MSNPFWLIAWREFTKVVRKPTFWASTLLMPALFFVVMVISGASTEAAEEKFEESARNVQKIWIVDESGLINSALVTAPYVWGTDAMAARTEVMEGKADALFHYPADLVTEKRVQIVTVDEGFIANQRFNEGALALIDLSILSTVPEPAMREAFYLEYVPVVQTYDQGVLVDSGAESLVIPIVSVIAFFLMTSFGVSFFLMSVAEEKENRMMEVMLSTVRPSQLIWGKVLGLLGVVLVQILFLVGLGIAVMRFASEGTPLFIDFSKLDVSLDQVLLGVFYLLAGYIFMANIMVGVGAVMPTYKEAQSFSSVFVILSILPIYLSAIIVTDPSGQIAQILSYLPFTGPIVLLFRNALNEISWVEQILSALVLLGYVAGSAWMAFQLFGIGSMQYTERLSLRGIWRKKPRS